MFKDQGTGHSAQTTAAAAFSYTNVKKGSGYSICVCVCVLAIIRVLYNVSELRQEQIRNLEKNIQKIK